MSYAAVSKLHNFHCLVKQVDSLFYHLFYLFRFLILYLISGSDFMLGVDMEFTSKVIRFDETCLKALVMLIFLVRLYKVRSIQEKSVAIKPFFFFFHF